MVNRRLSGVFLGSLLLFWLKMRIFVVIKTIITMSKNNNPEGYLTWEEILEKYPDRWVLVENPVKSTKGGKLFEGGIFRYKNKKRDKCYDKATELRLKNITVAYTGEPIDSVFVL